MCTVGAIASAALAEAVFKEREGRLGFTGAADGVANVYSPFVVFKNAHSNVDACTILEKVRTTDCRFNVGFNCIVKSTISAFVNARAGNFPIASLICCEIVAMFVPYLRPVLRFAGALTGFIV